MLRKILFPDPKGWNFSAWFWSFYKTKFTEILWNNAVFELPKEHHRCSIECTDFNTIEIMCLREAQAARWEVRMCLRQAQVTCNGIIGGWACRSHCGVEFFCLVLEFLYHKVHGDLLKWWRFWVLKGTSEMFYRVHGFNAIEIMCLRQNQAPCNGIIGGWACRSHSINK